MLSILIVTTRKERTNHLRVFRNLITLHDVIEHGLIDCRRRIAVVGGLLRFEFVDKFFVVVELLYVHSLYLFNSSRQFFYLSVYFFLNQGVVFV